MPLKSKAQAAYLKANEPSVFRRYLTETPMGTKLPARVKPRPTKKGR